MIFINYRSGAHSVAVSALAERLGHHFGQDQVFFDAHLLSGSRYPDELREHLNACEVLLAVIHSRWADDLAERASGGLDWVEYEIATALVAGKTVIPLVLDQAELPRADEVPSSVAELTLRQAARLRTANFTSDINALIERLESHVIPVQNLAVDDHDDVPVDHPRKQLGLKWKTLAWSLAFALVLLPYALSDWGTMPRFLGTATASTLMMLPYGLLLALFLCAQPAIYRFERRTGPRSFRNHAVRIWALVALALIVVILSWRNLVQMTSELVSMSGDLRIFVTLAGIVGVLYWYHRLYSNLDLRDTRWPPIVTLEPAVFRRAAWRLHEQLAAGDGWQRPLSRLQQEQAVSTYLRLCEVRLKLEEEARTSRREWTRAGCPHGRFTAFHLGWATTTIAHLAIACWYIGAGTPAWIYIWGLALLIIILTLAAITVAVDFRMYHMTRKRLVEELTELQAQLGPLVFMQKTGP